MPTFGSSHFASFLFGSIFPAGVGALFRVAHHAWEAYKYWTADILDHAEQRPSHNSRARDENFIRLLNMVFVQAWMRCLRKQLPFRDAWTTTSAPVSMMADSAAEAGTATTIVFECDYFQVAWVGHDGSFMVSSVQVLF